MQARWPPPLPSPWPEPWPEPKPWPLALALLRALAATLRDRSAQAPLSTPRPQVRWEDKISRAVFTGNMKTSPNRQAIFHQARRMPEL